MLRTLLARILYRPYRWMLEGFEASAVLGFEGTPARSIVTDYDGNLLSK